jgi:hypothetical protein
MDDQTIAGVRAIIARNDALSRESVNVLYAELTAQQAGRGELGSSNRWIAIAQLLETEGRKLIKATGEDVRSFDKSPDILAILEPAYRSFLHFLEKKYFDVARNGAAFGGSRPNPDHGGNPQSRHWWAARNRLELEIEVIRTEFSQLTTTGPAKKGNNRRNKGGKPLAEHWDQMWAAIAVQLWQGDLKPKRQADVKRAMETWLDAQGIDASDTAIIERARCLWREIETSE